MKSVLWKAGLRQLLRQRLQTTLAVLGVALGVAVVVAVDVANEAARRSFADATERVTGRASHQIRSNGPGVPEQLYRQIRVDLGVRSAAPVVSGDLVALQQPGRVLQLLGVDVFAEAPFRSELASRAGFGPGRLLTEANSVLLTSRVARRLQAAAGDTLAVLVNGAQTELSVLAVIGPEDTGLGGLDLVVSDIATAQALLGQRGMLSRIDLALPDGERGQRLAVQIRALLPAGVSLQRADLRSSAVARLSGSFQLNLTAMSLLALLVGMFLIYNTMTFSVVRRRTLLGRLRAIGVHGSEILRLVMLEALLIGLVGTTLGLALGSWLGVGLTDLAYQTIDDLYYPVSLRLHPIAGISLAKGLLMGVLASLAAAWFPAREAAAIPPTAVLSRSILEQQARNALPRSALIGLLLILTGTALLALPVSPLLSGFGGLFLMVLGAASLTPGAVVLLTRVLQGPWVTAFGIPARMAIRDLHRHLSRTGVAVAALMVAVATTIGVGIMIDSFRVSVSDWLGALLNADLYVAPAGAGESARLRADTLAALRGVAGVDAVATYRHRELMLNDRLIRLVAIQPVQATKDGYRLLAGDPQQAWQDFDDRQAVLVSEPLARHLGLESGQTLNLETATGPASFRIAGVFVDYGSEQGRVLLRSDLYQRLWRDLSISSVALYTSATDLDSIARRIEREAGALQPLRITANRILLQRSLAVFDRTFAITGVLRLLAMLIAFVGIVSALLAMMLERAREFAILRANGMLPGEIGRLIAVHTGLLGLAAGVAAIPTGLMLAAVLVYVINPRIFGWTMGFQVDPMMLLQAVVMAVLAALLAAAWPIWRLTRLPPAAALRQE